MAEDRRQGAASVLITDIVTSLLYPADITLILRYNHLLHFRRGRIVGLVRSPGKTVSSQEDRGFESRSLRISPNLR